jgi:hypothetical protein
MRSPDGALEMMNVNLTVSLAGGAGVLWTRCGPSSRRAGGPGGARDRVGGINLDYMNAVVRHRQHALVTIVLVVVILLLVYRAPIAALVPLVTIAAAFLISRGVLGYLASAGWKISSLLDTFVVVLVFGVGTDYTIFLISRFREEVGKGNWQAASQTTVKRIGAVITASAATVIVGLGSMAFGEFGMIQTTGPALAITIFVTLVAGLTLTPALLGIFGHYLFWPMHERDESVANPRSFFARLAAAVSRRPAVVASVLIAALLVPVAGIPAMRTSFDAVADLPANSDARAGFDLVAQHLGRGKIMPVSGVMRRSRGPTCSRLSLGGFATRPGLAATSGIQASPASSRRPATAGVPVRSSHRCSSRQWPTGSRQQAVAWRSSSIRRSRIAGSAADYVSALSSRSRTPPHIRVRDHLSRPPPAPTSSRNFGSEPGVDTTARCVSWRARRSPGSSRLPSASWRLSRELVAACPAGEHAYHGRRRGCWSPWEAPSQAALANATALGRLPRRRPARGSPVPRSLPTKPSRRHSSGDRLDRGSFRETCGRWQRCLRHSPRTCSSRRPSTVKPVRTSGRPWPRTCPTMGP